MQRIRVFLLGDTSHPQDLAAMSAEKELIERAYPGVEAVAPSEFKCRSIMHQVELLDGAIQTYRDRDFHEDLHAMLTCDGVILMCSAATLDDTERLMHDIAVKAGMRISNNTADVIGNLLRSPASHLDWRPKHVSEVDGSQFRKVGSVRAETISCLDAKIFTTSSILPVDSGRGSEFSAKFPLDLYVKVK